MKTSWTVEAAAIVLGVGLAGICLLGVGLLANPSGKAAPPPPAAGSVALQLCSPANSSGSVADSIVSSRDADRYPVARAIYTSVLNDDPRDRCAAEGLASLVAAEAESARPGTWIGRWSQSWSSTLKNWWQPSAAPLGAALGVAVLLVVVSWLLTPVLVRPDTSVAVGDRRASRLGAVLLVAAVGVACVLQSMVRQANPDPRLLTLGVATVAAAAVATIQVTTWRTLDARRHERRRHAPLLVGLAAMGAAAWVLVVTGFSAWWWLWCLGASLVAVVWMATSRGGRLAVSVTVRKDNKASDDSAQLLLARLSQLGSQPPKGIQGSPQTDVSALPDEAFTAVPGGAVAGTVFTLLRLVRSGVPWSFDVVLHGDDTVSWQTRRNGVSTENGVTVFRLADLGIAAAPTHDSQAPQSLPAQQPPLGTGSSAQPQSSIPRSMDDCLLTCAAAALLLTLSQAHPELKRGLCHAERWETVATYTLAMTAPRASSVRRQLLRKAQLIEPDFGLAAFAAAYVLPVSSLAQRQRFARELRSLFKKFPVPFPQPLKALDSSASERDSDEPRPGWEALHLRLLHGNAAAWSTSRC